MILPIVTESKDFINTYAYDCRDPVINERPERFQACSKPHELPYIWLLKPPAMKVDPISLEKINPESIPYNTTELSPTMFYNYIVNNIPDFTIKLNTVSQHNHFKEDVENADINKVLIISNKNKVIPEFKAIASHYKDRLLFGFVSSESKEVQELFPKLSKRPDLILYKSYDAENDQLMNLGEQILFNESISIPIMK